MDPVAQLAESFQSDSCVTVKLKDATKTIRSKALLVSASPRFEDALVRKEVPGSWPFQGSSVITLPLPACEADTFELFLYWDRHRSLPDFRVEPPDLTDIDKVRELQKNQQLKVIRLWAFASDFHIPKLQNAAKRALAELLDARDNIQAEAVALAFALTSRGSPLRGMVIHSFWRPYGYVDLDGVHARRELDLLSTVNGVMTEVLQVLSRGCGNMECDCAPDCFLPPDHPDFDVPED